MKSFELRNTDRFLRNAFYALGKYEMPFVYKQNIETSNMSLMGYQNTCSHDSMHRDKTIHFFMDDNKFQCVWNDPQRYIEKLSQYKYVMSPDFSIYTNMPLPSQIWNVFRRRWCSAYWQSNGLTVISSVTWSDERSFDFCFEGIEKGSVVAVSTIGSRKQKDAYLKGYVEMCRRLEPEKVLCYCKPFDEMLDMAKVITFPYEGLAVRKDKLLLMQWEAF